MTKTGYGGFRGAAATLAVMALVALAAFGMNTAAVAAEHNNKQAFSPEVARGGPAPEQATPVAAEVSETVYGRYESRGTFIEPEVREVAAEAGKEMLKQKLNRSSDADVKRASEARTCGVGGVTVGESSGVITGDDGKTADAQPPEQIARK